MVFFALAGLLIVGFNFGPFITSLYCLGLFLGTTYSVPPFRLKRFPVAAFLIIATVLLFSSDPLNPAMKLFGIFYVLSRYRFSELSTTKWLEIDKFHNR